MVKLRNSPFSSSFPKTRDKPKSKSLRQSVFSSNPIFAGFKSLDYSQKSGKGGREKRPGEN